MAAVILFILFALLIFVILAIGTIFNFHICFTNKYKILYKDGIGYCLLRYRFLKERRFIDSNGYTYFTFTAAYMFANDYFDSIEDVHTMIEKDKANLAKKKAKKAEAKKKSKIKTIQVVKG